MFVGWDVAREKWAVRLRARPRHLAYCGKVRDPLLPQHGLRLQVATVAKELCRECREDNKSPKDAALSCLSEPARPVASVPCKRTTIALLRCRGKLLQMLVA